MDEAVRHGVPLRLVYASLWERYAGALPSTGLARPSEQVLAEHIVASGAERAERRNPDVKVTTDILAEENTPEEEASALLDAVLGEAIAEHPRVRMHRTTIEGPAGKILVDRSAAADLVVIGARPRTGRFGLQLGRVSHTLLHHAQCPVAVVPQRP